LFIKTVAIFSATYTLQQLDRSLRNEQKNEKTSYRTRLVASVSLLQTQPNFASIPALQQYTGTWNTSFVPRHFKYKTHSDSVDAKKIIHHWLVFIVEIERYIMILIFSRGGDVPVANMSGQNVCVLRV
jgi:hypothetical protein